MKKQNEASAALSRLDWEHGKEEEVTQHWAYPSTGSCLLCHMSTGDLGCNGEAQMILLQIDLGASTLGLTG